MCAKRKSKEILEDDYITDVDSDSEILEEELDKIDEDILEETEYNDFDILFKDQQNKHKLEGKHRLERDIIFNGRIEEKVEDPSCYTTDFDYNEFSSFDILSISDQDDVVVQKDLEHDIYLILTENTELDFSQNRRKPKRDDFNLYYKILINKLKSKYTYSEIFVCLSYYFTDNIYNMFKILDKKYVSIIIRELKDKGYLRDLGNVDFV